MNSRHAIGIAVMIFALYLRTSLIQHDMFWWELAASLVLGLGFGIVLLPKSAVEE